MGAFVFWGFGPGTAEGTGVHRGKPLTTKDTKERLGRRWGLSFQFTYNGGSGERYEKEVGWKTLGCKERGEWAELCFMAKAAGLGMGVSKPLGDSRRYDVLVEAGGRILRVQVKSTLYRRRGNEYSLNVMGPQRKQYRPGTVDLFCGVPDSGG